MTQTGSLATQLSLEQAMERDALGVWTEVARYFIQGRRENHDLDFTSDDIRWFCGDPPGTGNILGALLAVEVRSGRLEVVGRRKSTRPGRHRARLNVYRGRTA